jgi:hypothetical protein
LANALNAPDLPRDFGATGLSSARIRKKLRAGFSEERKGKGRNSEGFRAFFDPTHAKLHELDRVLEIELLFDARAMGLHGLDADVEFGGNLARG